jgi:hypothetical protein
MFREGPSGTEAVRLVPAGGLGVSAYDDTGGSSSMAWCCDALQTFAKLQVTKWGGGCLSNAWRPSVKPSKNEIKGF